ncbi:efflux RND transporter periplasmic adaptor subunit [Paraglaciecola arctica]|uniref:RND family efflux transporter MFP subunit n=1 Tax=Paraglaciecola arctica BSs20135 TaxID=493475 RepID=K6Y712_9ALTE|nr:HlyD family efflux transporter periplasmic adaptor subunit [Paraglaciecola arctica]GAC19741.1 RND family efflux transporter MFP subunit [Paraglaciecola arctica BSs20135]
MDIIREKPKKKMSVKILGVVALIIILFFAVKLVFNRDGSTYAVNSNALLTDKVQQGELYVSVRGIGVLVPKDIRWVATNVEGRVERILIKAGALVKEGDLLMELSNPQLEQRLEETRWELDEMEAETTALEVSLESELLDQEAAVINEKLNHERALLTLNAQKTLLEQGVVAVSHIDHEEIKIDVAQFKQRWELEIKRLAKRRENLAAQRLAAQARLNRMRKILQRAQQQVDGLHVKATMDSIVQEMPMELGQQVSSGTNLARLARSGEFIAELRIPEKLINEVVIGQAVTVDTRTSKIQGKIKRIDPAVINGSVQVDVELTSDIPKEARPDLTVEGEIDIARINNTLFVQRPMFAKSFGQAQVYLLDTQGNSASRHEVTFGQTSTKYIEIKSGLKAGQNIIVSDVSSFEEHQQIKIN